MIKGREVSKIRLILSSKVEHESPPGSADGCEFLLRFWWLGAREQYIDRKDNKVSSTARNSFAAAVVGRSFVLSILFLVLVIALFFIPEIIHLQEGILKGGNRSQAASVSSYKVDEASERQSELDPSKNLSALDKVLVLVNSGYLGGGKDQPVTPDSVRARLNIPGAPAASAPEDANVSWKTIRTPQVSKVLKKAKGDVRSLAKIMDANQYQTKEALLNYHNGIGWLLEGDKSPIPVQQALNYIERLDLDVTRAMIKEGIDRSDYIRWSKISLGPLFENGKARHLKQEYLAPYNPRITLARVRIKLGKARVAPDGRVFPPPSSIGVVGFIMGRDTQKVVLLRNGRKIRTIPVRKAVDSEGKRTFAFSLSPANGPIAIQATDALGGVVQKTYRFLPRAAALPRAANGRAVVLPFNNELRSRSFDIREVDLRMDRYFRESVTSYAADQEGRASEKYQLVAF